MFASRVSELLCNYNILHLLHVAHVVIMVYYDVLIFPTLIQLPISYKIVRQIQCKKTKPWNISKPAPNIKRFYKKWYYQMNSKHALFS